MNRSQQGASVLEVLIALAILSTVLLGIAALHVSALAYQQRAQRHLLAVLAAQNLAERMRAAPSFSSSRYRLIAGDMPASASVCSSGACDADAFAAWQLSDWYSEFLTAQSLLPNAKAAVSCTNDCGVGDGRLITVYWNASSRASDRWDCNVADETSRDCYRLVWQR